MPEGRAGSSYIMSVRAAVRRGRSQAGNGTSSATPSSTLTQTQSSAATSRRAITNRNAASSSSTSTAESSRDAAPASAPSSKRRKLSTPTTNGHSALSSAATQSSSSQQPSALLPPALATTAQIADLYKQPCSVPHTSMPDTKCWRWSSANMGIRTYHDTMYGRCKLDSNYLYATLSYQIMMQGLSWDTIERKLVTINEAFLQFDVQQVAAADSDAMTAELLQNSGIVRTQRKIRAIIHNAKCIHTLDEQYASRHGFAGYIWQFLQQHMLESERLLPADMSIPTSHMRTNTNDKQCADNLVADGVHPTRVCTLLLANMKRHGFQQMGLTTVLTWLEACGFMNHHFSTCHVFKECEQQFQRCQERLSSALADNEG